MTASFNNAFFNFFSLPSNSILLKSIDLLLVCLSLVPLVVVVVVLSNGPFLGEFSIDLVNGELVPFCEPEDCEEDVALLIPAILPF